MRKLLRWVRLVFTPGVCARHGLKKTWYVGDSLSGPYYVCPEHMHERVLREFESRNMSMSESALPERLVEFERKVASLRVPVR